MKSFLKQTLATITGIIIASILFFIIMIGSLGALVASADKPATISKNSVLVLNTGLVIPERGLNDPFSTFDPVDFTLKPMPGINDIIRNLKKAARDERIKGVVIENGPALHGWSKAEEIRDALNKFKESGKFVVSYTDYYMTQESYYISTVADKIFLNPVAILEFKGISSDIMFYKKALDKIGVNVQVIRHGTHKGAVEPFLGNSLSKENRSQITRFINGIWDNVISDISSDRNILPATLNNIADNLLTTSLKQAMELNLIDDLLYRDEFKLSVKTLAGGEEDKDPDYISMSKYNNVHVSKTDEQETKNKGRIAVVIAEGTIVMGRGTSSNIGANHYASTIRKIREGDRYDAIVLRINSPGGNAMASDLIWREVDLAAQEMPVVVSMGNYAASGGYYIAAPADVIYAQNTTLTGSIGVFGLIPDASGLMENKLGINTETVKTNKFSDSPSVFRSLDNYEMEVIQQNVDKTYDDFITKVSNGRDIEKSVVDKMGEGQVYYGPDAVEKGLVDHIGGLDDAIEEAARMAELTAFTIVELPVVEDTYTKLMKSLTGEIRSRIINRELGAFAPIYNDLNEVRSLEGVQARIPYFINIK